MLNQLPVTPLLIKHLEKLVSTAEVGINHIELMLVEKPDTYWGSTKDIMIENNEDNRNAVAVIKDYIYRATHDNRGELIK